MVCKIGNLKLKNRVLLAPMLEPNDIAFRLLCKRAGCALTYSGMISSLSKRELFLDDKPILQLFGKSKRGIRVFMKKYDPKVSGWDFNLGCPSKLSKKLGHGAFMHENLDSIKEIFEVMRSCTRKSCTVKLRKSRNAIRIAKMAEECGFDAVCIHPRSFGQGYSGKADYDFSLKLKDAINIPVIYSGDVTKDNFNKILVDFDFVMVGRSAIGNPNFFSEIFGKKSNVGFYDYLKLAKKYHFFFRQIKFQAMCFSKGMRNAREIRRKLIGAKNVKEIEKIYTRK